jgi:prepilin-type N-terminal cleavage/methylation domain-containing protein
MVNSEKRASRAFTLIEVIIAGVILAVGAASLLSLTSRALQMQRRGEQKIVAAGLLDELLSTVLVEGPQDYLRMNSMSGTCEEPFQRWEYKMEIDDAVGTDPFRVRATVYSPNGDTFECSTLIAARLGEEPNPDRIPFEPIDREARWAELEEEDFE